ncbi:MAG: DUF4339 domain-containing protein [Bdellovibrionota bacterium]
MEADPNKLWYVYSGDKEIGPIKEVELRHRILTGNLQPESHAFTEGMGDWKPLEEIKELSELFKYSAKEGEEITSEFEKIPYAKNTAKNKSDRARFFLMSSLVLFVAATVYYFWDPTSKVEIAQEIKTVQPFTPIETEDPFTHKDWADLRTYRNRKDIVGSGYVLARDRIDEEFPVLKGAVSTNISAGEIEYRLYPVPGANLMPLPKILYGKTSIVNGYFVIGPLSDSGAALPTGKYRLIAKADHIFLGEVTLQRGILPEGEALQAEEEKLKAARFQSITQLKELYVQKALTLESILRELDKLKTSAVTPGSLNPAEFSAQARLTLEKFRDERLAINSLENDFLLLGSTGMELLQMVENLWSPLSGAFQEFPNPDPQKFVSIDTKGIIVYLQKLRMKVSKVATEEIAQRSQNLLNEVAIKKTLMNEGSAVR